jgi:hypothetical protein
MWNVSTVPVAKPSRTLHPGIYQPKTPQFDPGLDHSIFFDIEEGKVGKARRKMNSLGVHDTSIPEVREVLRKVYSVDDPFFIPIGSPNATQSPSTRTRK